MKRFEAGLVPLVLVPCLLVAQSPEVAPTVLEALVVDPAVVVGREQLLGRFDGLDSAIEIHAFEAEDRSDPGSVVAGVRIDLATNAWRTSVYLDQDQLAELSRDLNSMAGYRDDFANEPDPELLFGWRGRGTGACWMPQEPERILCPNYLIREGFETVWVNVFGADQTYPIATDELGRLAQLFEAAKEELDPGDLVESRDEQDQAIDATLAPSVPESAVAAVPTQIRTADPNAPDRSNGASGVPDDDYGFAWFRIIGGMLIVGGIAVLLRRIIGQSSQ